MSSSDIHLTSLTYDWKVDKHSRVFRDEGRPKDRFYSDSVLRDSWDTKISKWGPPKLAKRDAIYFDQSDVIAKDNFIIRCKFHYRSPETPEDDTLALRKLSEALFDVDTSTVRFTFNLYGKSDPRVLTANKSVLSARSSYFRTTLASPSRASKRRRTDSGNGTHPMPDVDDDDTVEWLPDEYLEQDKVEEEVSETMYDVGAEDVGDIKITDAGYISYRAMVYWLYTLQIDFHPSHSDFTVAVEMKNEPTNLSRRAFLLSKTDRKLKRVEPASPHAIYQLADKIDLPELKKLAKKAIVDGFSVNNVLYELVSTFSYQHDEIQTAAREFALKNWGLAQAESQGAASILAKLLKGTAQPAVKA
ncbi:hypothetical protein JCM8547_008763 [Rhodosporidiobolus lusitaniae]